jgi:acetolactate synthase-1/2/3 large subunit
MTTTDEILAEWLYAEGVHTLFGVMGDANMHLIDSYVEHTAGTYISGTREDSAVMMAHGYARTTGRLGVATVTCGPGFTNAITALVEVARSESPLVLITGVPAEGETSHVQRIDQRALARVVGADYVRVRSPQSLLADFSLAFRRAASLQLPVVIEMPYDWMDQEAEGQEPTLGQISNPRVRPDKIALDSFVDALRQASHPLLIGGRGVVRAGAQEGLVKLARSLGAPGATTLQAKGLFSGYEAAIGVSGHFATDFARTVIAESDCIIAFGASLNRFTNGLDQLFAGKTVLHCDIDPAQIGRWTSADFALVSDADSALSEIQECLSDHVPSAFADSVSHALSRWSPGDEFRDASDESTIDLRTFLIRLDDLLPAKRTVVSDSGRFMSAPARYLDVDDPRTMLVTTSFGAIGLALGAGIGAAVGNPLETTVVVAGDGATMMNLSEFNSAARHNLDLILVVVNDRGYGPEYFHLKAGGRNAELALFDWPSFADTAVGLGGLGVTVKNTSDLKNLESVLRSRGRRPLLIEVIIDPEVAVNPFFESSRD